MTTAHTKKVQYIQGQIKAYNKAGMVKKLRFYHGGSHSTRIETESEYFFIDISDLSKVIKVDTKKRVAYVEPNVPMDQLVKETLKYGLIPAVVMEFPGITVGGGVNGGALESSSYRYGQFNDTCIEYEIILADGSIVTANSRLNKDLFYGISGSYGSLGLISLAKVTLVPATQYVLLTIHKTGSSHSAVTKLEIEIKNNKNDYVEGIIFSKNHSAIITGKRVEKRNLPTQTFSKARDLWFYEYAKKITQNNNKYQVLVPTVDYLFRYNLGAFWMGEYAFPALHVPSWRITKFLLKPILNTRKLHDGFKAMGMAHDYFVQDFYTPFNKTTDLIEYSEKKLGIYPIWLCPIQFVRTSQKLSPHYIKADMLIDVGIWGQTEKYMKNPVGINREFEIYLKKIDARKMLYAHAYYTQEEFWKIFDKKWYEGLRRKYSAEKMFPTIWEKVRTSSSSHPHAWRGLAKFLLETLQGKNLNR